MAMNAKQRRHLIQQNQQDGNECKQLIQHNLMAMNATKLVQQKMAMNAKQTINTTNLVRWHLKIQQNQKDGHECQTKKTLNTTKLVGWQ